MKELTSMSIHNSNDHLGIQKTTADAVVFSRAKILVGCDSSGPYRDHYKECVQSL